MATPIKVPPLGENVDGGDIVKVLVKAGDTIAADQPLLELETGKATLEVPAPFGGRVEKVLVKPGDHVEIGQPVFEVSSGVEPAAPAAEEAPPAPKPEPAQPAAASSKAAPPPAPSKKTSAPKSAGGGSPIDLALPELGENIEGGDVVKVLIKPGDVLKKDQPVLELETGKATVEVPSPAAGTVTEVLAQPGMKLKIGDIVARLTGAATVAAPAAATKPKREVAAAPVPETAPAGGTAEQPRAPEPTMEPVMRRPQDEPRRVPVAAAPSVRRFAREIGVPLEDVAAHGPKGRITIEDVKRQARQRNTGGKVRTHCALEAVPLPDFAPFGTVERETMTKIRTVTAEHLSRSWATIPHVTQHEYADITKLEDLRKRFAPRAEQAGGKLTVTAILLRILAAALKVHPKFNASVDMAGRTIVYKKYCHIGIAVDTERGLLVPVLRDLDKKNIIQISVELGELAKKAREGKISPADLSGGCFTITNLGAIGGSFFTPIINAPEVAILGIGRGAVQPVYVNGALEPRQRLPLSLSYDHRLIDGADGARFMRWLVEAIEEPMLISLEG
jgi:pyruvate dehydrogenase E2 component (dihydrolipoamide acetyltransferase)